MRSRNATLFQDSKSAKKSWSVRWNCPVSRRRLQKTFGPGDKGYKAAEKYKKRLEAEFVTGSYKAPATKLWGDVRAEYEEKMMGRNKPRTRRCAMEALSHFERIIKPNKMEAITSKTIDAYVSARQREKGLRKGTTVAPASINKELRHLKAFLRVAHDWGELPVVPKIRMLKEPSKLATYWSEVEFAALYKAVDAAHHPKGLPYAPAEWWRSVFMFAYMTGWRISEILALRRKDLDLEAATAITRHSDNKGGRDEVVPLHSVVVDHLRRIASFHDRVFPWSSSDRHLYREFHKIRKAAGLPDDIERGVFHDGRRSFATMNADRMTPGALQNLMRHKSQATTMRYVNLARQLRPAVDNLHVPAVGRQDAKAATTQAG